MSGKRKIGKIPDQTAIIGSLVAKSFTETNGAKIITAAEITKMVTRRIKKDALIYSLAFWCSPLAVCPETKLIAPAEIPISLMDANITTKFKAAEKTPKRETESARAINNVNKKPQKADAVLPTKRIRVSFAVAVVARPKIFRIYLLTAIFYYKFKKALRVIEVVCLIT